MFYSPRSTYGSGYRAGHVLAPHTTNPFRFPRLLANCIWYAGWHDGTMKRLAKQLKGKGSLL